MAFSRPASMLAIAAAAVFAGPVLATGTLPATVRVTASSRAPWLAISDVHYGPQFDGSKPSPPGDDTNDALLTSMLAEAHRVDPNPPVVMIAGDFLAHHMPRDAAAATFVSLAKRFDATFPKAQFVITLGNNDSACGDYVSPVDGPFLTTVARAWQPLVDRNGAAPGFAKTFAHDGSYVATLPVRGLRAVVIDDIPFSLRYDDACSAHRNAAQDDLSELARALTGGSSGLHAWLLLHVPPGIDAYSTSHLTHHLAVVPFTKPHARESLEALVEDPRNHVSLVVAGHTHKFGYRILSGRSAVPLLLVPSVSPIFNNAPSFLTLGVDAAGSIGSVREYSYDATSGWRALGDLASLGVRRFDVAELRALQTRLAKSRELRAKFSYLYSGGGPAEIDETNWRSYWCAATEFGVTDFQHCVPENGFSVLTPRAIHWLSTAFALLVALAAAFAVTIAVLLRRRRRAAAGR